MSTVGQVLRTIPTRRELQALATQTELSAPAGRGAKGQFYFETVGTLMAGGDSWADAVQKLADANSVSIANIKAGYARYAEENGHPRTPSGSRSRRSSGGASSNGRSGSVPKDLEPILDAIRKDRQSLNNNLDALISWAQGQEAKVASAVSDAREAALRQIREAASSLK